MRTFTRSYLIRSYPNGGQRRLRDRGFGAYRWLWNTALEIRTEAYRQCGLTLTGNEMSRWLTQWKATQGHEWLKLVTAPCLTRGERQSDDGIRPGQFVESRSLRNSGPRSLHAKGTVGARLRWAN